MVRNEITYVQKATEAYGDTFLEHLRNKAFVDPSFLQHWAVVTELLNREQVTGRALDLGIGPGWSSAFLAARGLDVVGCDVSADMLAVAANSARRLGVQVDLREVDMQRELPPGPFDLVLIIDALHHCPNEADVFRCVYDVLAPGGMFMFVEPAWFHPWSPNSRHDMKKYGTTERGIWFLQSRRRLRAAGFSDVRRYYDCFAVSPRNPITRLKALLGVAMTLTVGYPNRVVVVTAKRPAAS